MATQIKITLTPFLAIASVIFLVLSLATLWNNQRTALKISQVIAHSQSIYDAHRPEIIRLIKGNRTFDEISNILDIINNPERDKYRVYVISTTETNPKIIGRYLMSPADGFVELTETQKNTFLKTVNKLLPTGTTNNFFEERWREGNILVFIPVNDEANTIGYIMVEVDRTLNI